MTTRNTNAPEQSPLLSPAQVRGMVTPLLAWYRKHQRQLPWRQNPSPYAVWVSEVMLQQTRVEVVRDYFSRWMTRLPTLQSLADASEAEVLHLWQGLGYYSRAKRLRQGAQHVVERHAGALPDEVQLLLSVPGIGPYSAGAIASIAYGKRAPLVDGNVIRVLSRYFALPGDPNKAPLKGQLWSYAEQLVPARAPGAFNQALMELGATVCTPKNPLCHSCPVNRTCRALAQGEIQRFPELPARKKPTARFFVVAVLHYQGRYALRRLPADATWWAGMHAFPFEETSSERAGAVAKKLALELGASRVGSLVELSPVKHTVTRFKLEMLPVVVELGAAPRSLASSAVEPVQWMELSELGQLALPSVFQKVARAVSQWERA